MNKMFKIQKEKPALIDVIRLTTSYWKDKKGIHQKKSISFMRRLSTVQIGILDYDSDMGGTDEIIPKIVNFDECEDGLYQVVICNEVKDWETGYVDDYDYKLIPYKTKET